MKINTSNSPNGPWTSVDLVQTIKGLETRKSGYADQTNGIFIYYKHPETGKVFEAVDLRETVGDDTQVEFHVGSVDDDGLSDSEYMEAGDDLVKLVQDSLN